MYEAHKWKIGEEITSEKLNHIEKGIEEAGLPREITDPQDGQTLKYDAASGKWVNAEGGGSSTLVVNVNDGTFDKTWQEIDDAFPNVKIKGQSNTTLLPIDIGSSSGNYYLDVLQINSQGAVEPITYAASSSDGYPKYVLPDPGM